MGVSRALIVAAASIASLTTAANAADLLPPPPMVSSPAVVAVQDFSGWYLRGDIGLGLHNNTKIQNVPNPLAQGAPGFNPTAYNLSPAAMSTATFIKLGVGYQINSWFRTDVTVEYRGSTFSANDELSWNNGAQFYVLRNFYRGNMASFVGLLNGYVDLGTWYGITPYVGAGAGFASTTLHGVTDNGYSNLYAGPGAFASSNTGGYYNSKTTSSFAWALMAGLSYNVTSNLKLDFGYRYLNYGKASAGAPNCFNGGPGVSACNNVLQFSRGHSHDFSIGLRWMLADYAPPIMAPPPPPPLIRKY